VVKRGVSVPPRRILERLGREETGVLGTVAELVSTLLLRSVEPPTGVGRVTDGDLLLGSGLESRLLDRF